MGRDDPLERVPREYLVHFRQELRSAGRAELGGVDGGGEGVLLAYGDAPSGGKIARANGVVFPREYTPRSEIP
jgi:hypothetical protein